MKMCSAEVNRDVVQASVSGLQVQSEIPSTMPFSPETHRADINATEISTNRSPKTVISSRDSASMNKR